MRPAALRHRSGNEPAGKMAQRNPPEAGAPWQETRAALGRLAESLSCSRCSDILKKPVNIGGCEHVFCLTCIGDCIGTACPVCHMPAMVQDLKVNRQLDNIIKIYSKLQSLQGRDFSGSGDNLCAPQEVTCESGIVKKEIKMWFSPRSRKMRFTLKKKSERAEQPVTPKVVTNKDSQPHDPSSVYDFVSSPPSQDPFKEGRKALPKCKRKLKKRTLRDINQQWGLLEGRQKNISRHGKSSPNETKETSVSFCSQTVVIPSPDPQSPPMHKPIMGEGDVQNANEPSTGGSSTSVKYTGRKSSDNLSGTCGADVESLTSEQCLPSEWETPWLKRSRLLTGSPTSFSKRLRRKEQSSCRRMSLVKGSPRQSSEHVLGKTSPTFDCVKSTPIVSTIFTLRSAGNYSGSNKVVPETPPWTNNPTQRAIQGVQLFSKKSPNNLSAKRNHKGETLLHIASIEGNLSTVEHLLKSGADPNVQDYAGWTPLHEACNHGHKEVAELLLQHGALLNAPGYQNDLPLHDAVKNGHTSVVELLLLHGASRDAVNIFGHKPVDYAETEKMKSLLMLSVNNESSTLTQCAEHINLNNPRDGPVVLLGSGLDPVKQQLLSKLAVVLKARLCTEFNSTVTHIIIPDPPVRSTMKCLLAVLAGSWILTFKWVEACLQSGAREQEEKYEVNGGPQRGRWNKEQLLPKLFDGCYFYFLGMFKEHNKDDLKELVKAGGGQILMRKPKSDNDVTQTINTVAYHAEITSDQSFCTVYIIYDGSSSYKPEKIRQGKVWEVPTKWLIDCVTSFQLLPVKQ
nr:BRCA1-associated RING domain protein 1 [Pogona vitticeps]